MDLTLIMMTMEVVFVSLFSCLQEKENSPIA